MVRARLGFGIAAVGASLLLSGCAAGQHAATAEKTPAIDGTQVQAGQIDLRAIAFPAPVSNSYDVGSDVPLEFVLVNTGSAADQLVSLSSPNFSGTTATNLTVEPGTAVQVGLTPDDPQVKLTKLAMSPGDATALFPGQAVPVTFTFKTAGAVTATVPVKLTHVPYTAVVPTPSDAPAE
jgi:copper(I)-binding protein